MHRDNVKWSIQAPSISVTLFVILLCHRAWNSSIWLFVRVTVSCCRTVAPQNMGACSSSSLHRLCCADPTWIPFHRHAVLETVVVRYFGSAWPFSADRMVILPQCASVTEEPHSFVVHHGCSPPPLLSVTQFAHCCSLSSRSCFHDIWSSVTPVESLSQLL